MPDRYDINPTPPSARDVCPHCKRPTQCHAFYSKENVRVEIHRCRDHGDVVPMRSAVVNELVDWSAA